VARTVYGRVAGGQDVSVDSYSDTVRATVTY
jgi:spore coat protein U-like protein